MDIIVIGGAGYIGSHVSRAFLDAGHSVTVFDNLSRGFRENLFPEAAFVQGDILDAPALRAAIRGKDAVIHLAALKAVGESMEAPERYAENNITGSLNILNAMAAEGCRSIVFSSSAAIYGEPERVPLDEEHPLRPESFYGFTKLEIERFLGWYDRLKSIRFAVLRYFNAAGYDPGGRLRGLEREPANLIPVVMEAAMGWRPTVEIFGMDYPTRDGTGIRDYVHVSDLARAHVLALDRIRMTDESLTVNLGSERGLSVLEILECARRVTGRPIPSKAAGRRPGDAAVCYASSAKARALLGWEPRFSDVETLVSTTWKAYEGRKEKP
jgi:UDP-glucose 4-epimerase